jgi:diketogulonate reductase-like aldo/keto reductase
MWGEFPDRVGGVALLRRVVGAGVTFIDTAGAYGPHTNEVLIRGALYPYEPTSSSRSRGQCDRAENLWPTLVAGRCPFKEVRESREVQAFG